MIRATLVDVVDRERDGKRSCTVLLLDEVGQRILPIWIGRFEGEAIAMGLRQYSLPRPMTFQFTAGLLEAAGARLEEVRIEALRDNTYYAVAKVRRGKTVREMDARPSDALALAMLTGSPIYVADDVMQQAGMAIPKTSDKAALGRGVEGILQHLEERRGAEQAPSTLTPEQIAQAQQELIRFVFGEQE